MAELLFRRSLLFQNLEYALIKQCIVAAISDRGSFLRTGQLKTGWSRISGSIVLVNGSLAKSTGSSPQGEISVGHIIWKF